MLSKTQMPFLLEKNQNKIDWVLVCPSNPNGTPLLERNTDKINWSEFSRNPDAIPVLAKHPEKIDWYWLSENPSIFTIDYLAMKENHRDLKEELIQKDIGIPSRIAALLDAGMELDDLEDM